MKLTIKVQDGSLSEDDSIGIEFLTSAHAAVVFGDDIEVEIEHHADETECIFPEGTGCLTEKAAQILAAHLVTAVENFIQNLHLPVFTVTTTFFDNSRPDSHTVCGYDAMLGMYPWLLNILPMDQNAIFSLSLVSGLTHTKILL